MIGFCSNCSKRDICTELCASAVVYADQDYVAKDFWLTEKSMNGFNKEDELSPEYGDVDIKKIDVFKVLTEAQKEVILMYFNDGLTPKEIAKKFNITKSAVSKRIERAKVKLRKLGRIDKY